MKKKFIHTYVSVDCVILGFDGEQINILLVKKDKANENALKLPGSLIYDDEDVDDAAHRVLFERTGVKSKALVQFRCFASPDRASSDEDMAWLDVEYQPNINRLITVAYLSLLRIDQKLNNISKYKETQWCPLSEMPKLPFDHNLVVTSSLHEIRRWIELDSSLVYELLPRKFIISQLHKLHEAIYDKKIDIRNFHKKITSLPYINVLEEKQKNVSHRAARFYKFNRQAYNKIRGI